MDGLTTSRVFRFFFLVWGCGSKMSFVIDGFVMVLSVFGSVSGALKRFFSSGVAIWNRSVERIISVLSK